MHILNKGWNWRAVIAKSAYLCRFQWGAEARGGSTASVQMENENNWLQLGGQAGPPQTKIPWSDPEEAIYFCFTFWFSWKMVVVGQLFHLH